MDTPFCLHCLKPIKPRVRLVDGKYVEIPAECWRDWTEPDWSVFLAEQLANVM